MLVCVYSLPLSTRNGARNAAMLMLVCASRIGIRPSAEYVALLLLLLLLDPPWPRDSIDAALLLLLHIPSPLDKKGCDAAYVAQAAQEPHHAA